MGVGRAKKGVTITGQLRYVRVRVHESLARVTTEGQGDPARVHDTIFYTHEKRPDRNENFGTVTRVAIIIIII